MEGAHNISAWANNAKATQTSSPTPINDHHHPNNQTPPLSKLKEQTTSSKMMEGARDISVWTNNAKLTQPSRTTPISEEHHPNNQTPPS